MELPLSLLESMLHPGIVLHSWDILNIDHGKFFVILGVKDNSFVGFFFINSNINRMLEDKPDLFALQYLLRAADYPFLRYDSFLSASHLKEIDKDELTAQLKNGVAEIVGELKKEHLCDVKEMCLASRIFTAADKAAYFM